MMLNKIPSQILGFIGLSALLMVLARASEAHVHLLPFLKFNQTSNFGFIFFASAISFCVNQQLSLDFKHKKINLNYLLRYYLKVVIFILPMYWVALIIMYILDYSGIQTTSLINSHETLLAYMSFSELRPNLYIVHILLLYFILCPFTNYLIDWATEWDISMIVFVVLLAIVVIEFANQNIPFGKFHLMKYLSIFFISSLAAYFVNFGKQIKILNKRNSKILNHFASISIILLILSFKSVHEFLFNSTSPYTLQSFYLYFSLLASIIILSALYGNGILKTILGSKPLKVLGTISIGLYVIHWPVLITIYNVNIFPLEVKAFVYLGLLLAFGFLSLFAIILPLLKLVESGKS